MFSVDGATITLEFYGINVIVEPSLHRIQPCRVMCKDIDPLGDFFNDNSRERSLTSSETRYPMFQWHQIAHLTWLQNVVETLKQRTKEWYLSALSASQFAFKPKCETTSVGYRNLLLTLDYNLEYVFAIFSRISKLHDTHNFMSRWKYYK